MTIVVNQELCSGCGACESACDNGAIRMNDGLAVIDQEKCTSCRVCMDVCPSGALEVSKVVNDMTVVEPHEVEIIESKPVCSAVPERAHWSTGVLALLGQYVLPRLVDGLTQYLEQRLSAPPPSRSPMVFNQPGSRPFRRRRQVRRRFSNNFSERR